MNIIDFFNYKKRKDIDNILSRDRIPLYIDYLNGTITGNKDKKFGDKIIDIKEKIKKINELIDIIRSL